MNQNHNSYNGYHFASAEPMPMRRPKRPIYDRLTSGKISSREARRLRRLLIVGADAAGRKLAHELATRFPAEYEIVGFVGDTPDLDTPNLRGEAQVLGRPDEIGELVQRYQIDQAVIVDYLFWELGDANLKLRSRIDRRPATAQDRRQRVQDRRQRAGKGPRGKERRSSTDDRRQATGDRRQTSTDRRASQDRQREMDGALWLESHGPVTTQPVRRPFANAVKRGFDILLAATTLVVASPAMALIMLGIKLTSRGPIFFGQKRVGRNGQLFTLYKFRTMVEDAETQTGPTLATSNDPRSTPIGRILRLTHLDELPQFYNVLRGDMSIVGPRPERPAFVQIYNRYIPHYDMRHVVCPGITGLAQVYSGYRTHVYVKLHYDLRYIASQSFWLDLWILARTAYTIMRETVQRES